MTLIEDARRMLTELGEGGPRESQEIPYSMSWCAMCSTDAAGHTSDCPWLNMPKIVAVLEAADRLTTADSPLYDRYQGGANYQQTCVFCGDHDTGEGFIEHYPDCAYRGLVAALKGESA